MKLRKGDKVSVRTGKDKGKTGKILRVYPKTNMVLVEGINIYKRHRKARSQKEKSAIIDVTRPMQASKVSFVDPKSNKPAKIGYHVSKGEKVRISKASGQAV